MRRLVEGSIRSFRTAPMSHHGRSAKAYAKAHLAPIHVAFLELIIDPACSIVLEVERAERDVMSRPPSDPRVRIRTRFDLMFQFYKLIPSITARENLTLATAVVTHLMPPEEAR
jgi:ABC-type arginine transport system ATPase subunit